MDRDRRAVNALAALLPAGALGLSVSLAWADAQAALSAGGSNSTGPGSVAGRLQAIRETVTGAMKEMPKDGETFLNYDPEQRLAWWGNGGWGNWHNWHNWGNGWGNGWHNGWRNW